MHLKLSNNFVRLIALLILGHLWYFAAVADFRLSDWFRSLDLLLLDTEVRFSDSSSMPTRSRPVVLGLTRRDVKEFGSFPWPRARWAEVIQKLDSADVNKIVLDVFFISKGTDEKDDQKLVKAIRESRRVLLPVYSSVLIDPTSLEGGGVNVGQIQLNEPTLQTAAAGTGHINAFLDVDEKIRFVPLFLRHRKQTYYQISIEALKNTDASRTLLSELQVDEKWPGMLIDYRGFDNRYEFYSIGELLRNQIKPGALRGKTIFVGQTTQGLPFADIVSTPIGLRHGIFILACLFDQIRSGIILQPLTPLDRQIFIYCICLCSVLLAGFLNQRLRILSFLLLPVLFFLVHIAFFQNQNLILPYTSTIIALSLPMFLAFVSSDFYFRFITQRKLEQAEKLSGIGRMAGMIAHDIRNPLSIIQGQAQLLLARGTPSDAEKLRSIERQAKRIAVMLEELLDYSTKQIQVQLKPVNLVAFLKTARQEIENDFCIDKKVSVELVAKCPEGQAQLDDFRFQRALENLVKNSIQALADGGKITLELSENPEHWLLRIQDNGPGLPAQVRRRLFEPFVTSGKEGGIGLGLAITREIIHVHRGSIELESTGPSGTAFLIRIPRR